MVMQLGVWVVKWRGGSTVRDIKRKSAEPRYDDSFNKVTDINTKTMFARHEKVRVNSITAKLEKTRYLEMRHPNVGLGKTIATGTFDSFKVGRKSRSNWIHLSELICAM